MQEYIEFASNNPALSLAWVAIAGFLIYSFGSSAMSKVKSVNNHEATALMNKENAIVVDVRAAENYRKSHILNAINVPVADIEANKLSMIEKYKNTPIIVMCDTGMSSGRAANRLAKMDFTTVYNLSGGMASWQEANLPTVKK
ncbi:Rhodanese-related sulfurtransferase [Moritella sp. JT01]|uniref:rhodanese-like domain-containing protein n=1 Tax=Moritella sp. JT01 TaxID=756698 RepID=UPI000796CF0A|nr:rhodanese-like domain-containing protein [Moritella sp. JT01]KXO11297.1 Rhodanese-related sulfurtransferase [Moritella sp. JT01]